MKTFGYKEIPCIEKVLVCGERGTFWFCFDFHKFCLQNEPITGYEDTATDVNWRDYIDDIINDAFEYVLIQLLGIYEWSLVNN